MVSRNVPFERELVEQNSLVDLPMSHHDLQSCISAATESVNVMRRNNRLFQQNRSKADMCSAQADVRYVPCVDGSELARTFFTFAALVGAAMCSAC
jgi:hypothetical protein